METHGSPTSPSGDPVREGLARLRARWTKVHGARLALQVLFYALLAGAAVAFVFPELPWAALVATLLAASVLVGLAGALAGRPGATALAKEYDDRAGLRDRVSSAVELERASGPMVEALREDARAAAARLVPATVVPMRVPREGYWLPVPALVFAGAVLLGGLLDAKPPRDLDLQQTLEQRLAQLDELVSEERRKEGSERRKELLEELEQLKVKLRPEEAQKKDALEEVAKLRDELEQQRERDLEKERELAEKLDELTPGQKDPKLDQAIQNGDYAEALKRLKELQEELEKKLREKKDLTEQELAELEELLKKLQEIEAKLMKLLQIQLDLAMLGDVLDFLADFDGELADLEDFEPCKVLKLDALKPADCEGCQPCAGSNPLVSRPTLKAGKGTTEDFLAEEGRRTDHTREEEKVSVKQTTGKSTFTQTQVANDGSRSNLAAKEILLAEKRAAEDTIQRQDVPAGYRKYLETYFKGIESEAAEPTAGDTGGK